MDSNSVPAPVPASISVSVPASISVSVSVSVPASVSVSVPVPVSVSAPVPASISVSVSVPVPASISNSVPASADGETADGETADGERALARGLGPGLRLGPGVARAPGHMLRARSAPNADGEGDYYDGLTPSCPAPDDLDAPRNAPEEASTAAALAMLAGTGCPSAGRAPRVAATPGTWLAAGRYGPNAPPRADGLGDLLPGAW